LLFERQHAESIYGPTAAPPLRLRFVLKTARQTAGNKLGLDAAMISKTMLSQQHRCVRAVLCIASLAGCTVGSNFMAPNSGLSKVVLAPRQDYTVPLSISEAEVPTMWWLLFDDPLLAKLQLRAQDD